MMKALGLAWMLTGLAAGQVGVPGKTVTVSGAHPVNSIGETVYTVRGDEDPGGKPVPGVLIDSKPVKRAKLHYSKAMKKEHYTGTIVLYGVITAAGNVIDLEPDPTGDPEANAVALTTVASYRFAPALLNGEPVATRLKVEIHFELR